MIGYGQFEPASSSLILGFKVVITNINLTTFLYNWTTYQVSTCLLHYMYLAIQYETTTFYTDIKYLACNKFYR